MNKVSIERAALHTVLETNRKQHKKDYRKALDAYRKKKKIAAGFEKQIKEKLGKEISFSIHIAKPADYTNEYDRVIKMLDYEVNETIELTKEEFSQYVEDNWDWSKTFGHAFKSNTGIAYKGENAIL